MKENYSKLLLRLASLSNWLIIIGIVWLLGTIGLGWVINSLLIVIGLLVLTPVIAFGVMYWWVNRRVVIADCPVCSEEVIGFNDATVQCSNCGTVLEGKKGKFQRVTEPGTVDVIAVEISPLQLEE